MYGIIANHIGDKVYRIGAKVYIIQLNIGNGGESVEVKGISHGGRRVRKWIRGKYLYNTRIVWLPEHIERISGCQFNSKEEAEKELDRTVLRNRRNVNV